MTASGRESAQHLDDSWACEALRGSRVLVTSSLSDSESWWRAATSSCTCSIFQTYEWLSHWFDAIGRGEGSSPYLVRIETTAGSVVLALPLAVHRTAGVQVLSFLGGGMTDYNLPLLNAALIHGLDAKDMDRLWAIILSMLPRVDVCWLRRVPAAFDGTPNPLVQLRGYHVSGAAFAATLPDSFADFVSARSANFFKNTRSYRRRLEREFGSGSVTAIVPSEESPRVALARWVVDTKSQWQRSTGQPDTFARNDYIAFYESLTRARFAEGVVEVVALTVNGEVCAGMWNACFRDRYAVIVTTYDEKWSRYSVGRLLTEDVIQRCIARPDLAIFDLTIGGEAYKSNWTDQSFDVYDQLKGRTVKGLVFVCAYRSMRYLIHRFPGLNRWAHKAASIVSGRQTDS